MLRYTFAVNRVNDKGMHERQEGKTIQVDAPNEDVARSLARTKLRDWSPGQQRFHPAELMSPPAAIATPVSAAPAKPVETVGQQAADALKGKPS